MVELKIPPRGNGYARGKDIHEQILRAAYDVLIDEGVGALTMRKIAGRCNLQAGHMRYYFVSKQDLIRELLSAITQSYTDMIAGIVLDPNATPEKRLENIVSIICDDIATKDTTRVFTSLWGQSNYDDFINNCVNKIYEPGRILLGTLVRDLNPNFDDEDISDITLFMQSSLEGLTIFAGFGKSNRHKIEKMKKFYVSSFLAAIKPNAVAV